MDLNRIMKLLCVLLVLSLPYSNGIDYAVINYPFAITLPEIVIGLAVIVSAIKLLDSRKSFLPKTAFFDILCAAWITVAIMLSSLVHPLAQLDAIGGKLAWLFILFITTFYVVYTINDIYLVSRAIVFSATLVAIIAIGQSFFELWLHVGRPLTAESIERYPIGINRSAGPYSVYGRFGMLMLLSLPIAIVAVTNEYSDHVYHGSNIRYITIALIVLGIISSQTRSTIILSMLLSFIMVSIIYYAQNKEQTYRIVTLGIGVGMILVTASAIFIAHVGIENIVARIEANIDAVQIFSNNPLIGIGFGTYSNEAFRTSTGIVIHSAIFELMVVAGIFGTIPFIALCSINLSRAFRLFSDITQENIIILSVVLGCLGAIGHTQTFRGIYAEELWFIFGLLPAIYYAHKKDEQTSNKS